MNKLIIALNSTGYAFAHFGWAKAPSGDYGVYSEEGTHSVGNHYEEATQVIIDYYTRNDDGSCKSTIENAIKDVCAYTLNNIIYESDTGYIHYEWVVEVIG